MSPPLRPTSKRSIALLLLVVAAAIAALGSLRVQRQHQVVKLGYELTEATADLRVKREENRRLRLELSVLRDPERIEKLAEGMGLAPPSPGQIRSAGGEAKPESGEESSSRSDITAQSPSAKREPR